MKVYSNATNKNITKYMQQQNMNSNRTSKIAIIEPNSNRPKK